MPPAGWNWTALGAVCITGRPRARAPPRLNWPSSDAPLPGIDLGVVLQHRLGRREVGDRRRRQHQGASPDLACADRLRIADRAPCGRRRQQQVRHRRPGGVCSDLDRPLDDGSRLGDHAHQHQYRPGAAANANVSTTVAPGSGRRPKAPSRPSPCPAAPSLCCPARRRTPDSAPPQPAPPHRPPDRSSHTPSIVVFAAGRRVEPHRVDRQRLSPPCPPSPPPP